MANNLSWVDQRSLHQVILGDYKWTNDIVAINKFFKINHFSLKIMNFKKKMTFIYSPIIFQIFTTINQPANTMSLSKEDTLRIVKHFLLSSPPGEFEDVLSGIQNNF
jgi:hypothetical protein